MNETADQPLSLEARHAARALRKALSILIEMNPRMSTAQAMTFIRVAWEEGLTVTELARRCEVQPNTISKHLRDLGSHGRGRSLELVTTIQHLGDRREHRVVLTARGVAIARTMIAIVKRR
jgi:DNA-binding MarR family transcriptional regulator